MCGIAGQIAFPEASRATVEQMISRISHRGPDGQGIYSDGPAALGHARLSIIDIGGGAQPMFNEDRSVAVVFNGEIYNYRELRAEIAGRHQLCTESDTEVLVHLYEDLGENFVERLHGMFAFAIWDGRRRKLICARDRFGEKPLFYTEKAGSFSFSSELSGLFAVGLADIQIDESSLANYLELLYVPSPKTILKDAKKLQPGWLLVVDEKGVSTRPYWRPPVPGEGRPEESLRPEELLSILQESVSRRMHADVEVAALLSGGIDSSIVTGLMSRVASQPIRTFSVGFGNVDDETPFAREVSEHFKTNHHEIFVHPSTPGQIVEDLAWYPEPFGDSSVVPTMAVAKEVARHVKVVLTGDGGDELFGGYGRYFQVGAMPHLPGVGLAGAALSRFENSYARKARRFAHAAGSVGGQRYRALTEVFDASARKRLMGRSYPPAAYAVELGSAGDSAIAFDLAYYLPDDLLVKVDIATMRYGLESRCPFLDHVLAERVIPLPLGQKVSRNEGKILLKRAAQGLLPRTILERKKRGFGSPVNQWLAGGLRHLMMDTIGSQNSPIFAYLNRTEVHRVVEAAGHGKGNSHQAWSLLVLDSWLRQFDQRL